MFFIQIHKMFTVSYDVFACDDHQPERVIRGFTDFVEAVKYWADCSETEDNCHFLYTPVISMEKLPEYSEAIPF